eukprot:CAMPEP_0119377392 /NCGR_PEP_ID=MMETSP1334-20130426/44630_1 /TAXON_ID=127549 /ORGANISM="Calcidiscus leptoporus, Strain RCC1130" /LENGTH=45 /DNA_ID= /DNA_START= /DNA_END= /DNA_ORIENTATION=
MELLMNACEARDEHVRLCLRHGRHGVDACAARDDTAGDAGASDEI